MGTRNLRWPAAAILLLACAIAGCGERAASRGAREVEATPSSPPSSAGAAPGAPSVAGASAPVPGTPAGGLSDWITDIRRGIASLAAAVVRDAAAAQRRALDLYVSRQEYIELYYGPRGRLSSDVRLGEAVQEAEQRFHELMRLLVGPPPPDSARVRAAVEALDAQLTAVERAARAAGAPPGPGRAAAGEGGAVAAAAAAIDPPAGPGGRARARTEEIAGILAQLDEVESAYASGEAERALGRLNALYLDRFEPIEARLEQARVDRIEQLIHFTLRPQLDGRAAAAAVAASFTALRREFLGADAELGANTTFWFGAVNSFVILTREGLEAVLLIAALLAYLGAIGAQRRHHRQIYAGAAFGVAASLVTWLLARTLLPIDGGSRELIEGITGLVAVAVLLYVSHWLFQKTYLHDWKAYLQERLGHALSTGSALAMAGLAFAAVYREGFETVLFYQALLFDSGAGAVLAGAIPGALVIGGLGVVIIRLGLKLPLRQVFAATNALLLYLAFGFVGKSLYNLQEAGVFTPRPLPWFPDHAALRQLLGTYPLAESLAAQAAFLLLVLGAYLYFTARRASAAQRIPAPAPGEPRNRSTTATTLRGSTGLAR